MKSISVHAEHEYRVEVGVDWRERLQEVLARHNKVMIIASENIAKITDLTQITSSSAQLRLTLVPDGESAKDISVAIRIWDELGTFELGRRDAIVALGGGTATDLSGFIAATWLRGVDWYAFPTTLAGMVDAAVGGKTGINTESGKNLVGAFHSPRAVFIDISFLATLSDRDFSAGLAEVIKTGYIADPEILHLLASHPSVQGARSVGKELITRSVEVKASVVSQDFTESSLREILNYGHTLGHAVEKLSGYSLRHGEAVAIGLVFAAELSVSLLKLPASVAIDQISLLKSFGLPTTISKAHYPWEDILAIMMGDKKARNGELRFIGLEEVGKPAWISAPDHDVLAGIYERMTI